MRPRHSLRQECCGILATLILELHLPLFGIEFERGVTNFMKTHFENRSLRKFAGNALAGIFVLCLFAFTISGQAPPNPVPAQENIPAGAFIIPMDNFNQGNNAQTTFNLRAYGLANLLLQNDIPVKWAIKPAKSKDDTDFTASFTRVQGTAGSASGTNVAFTGGPFIVMPEYEALVTPLLGLLPTVTVYRTTAAQLIDIRYTLTHKPRVAIGPDGGNFGTNVHQNILESAGITNYKLVTDDIISPTSCFSIATQAHSTDPTFVNQYRAFVQSGANLLLQCASIGTFENNANGHFQTTIQGYSLFGTNAPSNAVDTTLVYPEGAMPFNQFIGILANQDGAVTEYAYAPGGGPANGNRVSVRNSGADADKFVATVSGINGPNAAGGMVFELGGHDYTRTTTGASAISRINGSRMFLNALFVPATRPAACGVEQPRVLGFKSVRRAIPDASLGGPIKVGNTVEWIVDYINNSGVSVPNFQIRDIVQANLTLVAGSNLVTVVTPGSTATRNASYDGIGNDSTSDLLAPGAFLAVNGRIQIKVRMIPNINTPAVTILRNQTSATGTGLIPGTSLNSDNVDTTSIDIAGPGTTPPAGSVPQTMNPASNDPTTFPLAPTAASVSIEGSVRDTNGNGIFNALVTAMNAANGVATSVRTNSMGQYLIEDLQAGDLYIVTVQHKRYRFPNGTVTFTLSDSVTGLAFIGNIPEVKGGRMTSISPIKSKR